MRERSELTISTGFGEALCAEPSLIGAWRADLVQACFQTVEEHR